MDILLARIKLIQRIIDTKTKVYKVTSTVKPNNNKLHADVTILGKQREQRTK